MKIVTKLFQVEAIQILDLCVRLKQDVFDGECVAVNRLAPFDARRRQL